MSQERFQQSEASHRTSDLSAGISIGAGAFLLVLLMAHHPSIRPEGMAGAIAQMNRVAGLSGLVHGGLIVIVGVMLFGFSAFALRLGWSLARVRLGMVAYGLGSLFMMGAAAVNGFIVTDLSRSYDGATAAELEILRHLLRLCHATNQVLAGMGAFAMSIGIVSWSLVMVFRAGSARVVGSLGLAAGAFPILGLLTGALRLDLHGEGAVVVAQAIWSLSVAAWLLRRGTPN